MSCVTENRGAAAVPPKARLRFWIVSVTVRLPAPSVVWVTVNVPASVWPRMVSVAGWATVPTWTLRLFRCCVVSMTTDTEPSSLMPGTSTARLPLNEPESPPDVSPGGLVRFGVMVSVPWPRVMLTNVLPPAPRFSITSLNISVVVPPELL